MLAVDLDSDIALLPGYIKNAQARSPPAMDLRPLRTAAAEEDVKSMVDYFDHT